MFPANMFRFSATPIDFNTTLRTQFYIVAYRFPVCFRVMLIKTCLIWKCTMTISTFQTLVISYVDIWMILLAMTT